MSSSVDYGSRWDVVTGLLKSSRFRSPSRSSLVSRASRPPAAPRASAGAPRRLFVTSLFALVMIDHSSRSSSCVQPMMDSARLKPRVPRAPPTAAWPSPIRINRLPAAPRPGELPEADHRGKKPHHRLAIPLSRGPELRGQSRRRFGILGGSGAASRRCLRFLIGLEQPIEGKIDIANHGPPISSGLPPFGVMSKRRAVWVAHHR